MTRDEVKGLLLKISSLYPTFKITRSTLPLLIDSWASELTDINAKDAHAALSAYNHTNTTAFGPSISQILSFIHRMQNPESAMSEGEAWDMIHKAICNGSYGATDEFARLPQVLQRVVGSPDQLRQWAMMDIDKLSVVQATCMRTFRSVNKQDFEMKSMPENVKALMADTVAKIGAANDF